VSGLKIIQGYLPTPPPQTGILSPEVRPPISSHEEEDSADGSIWDFLTIDVEPFPYNDHEEYGHEFQKGGVEKPLEEEHEALVAATLIEGAATAAGQPHAPVSVSRLLIDIDNVIDPTRIILEGVNVESSGLKRSHETLPVEPPSSP
jgi:hypothetical protein